MAKKVKNKEERLIYRVSVRTFVEFILRSGDIDNRRGNLGEAEAMLEGMKLHRRIQKSMDSGYSAEVALKLCLFEDDYDFILEGRADGVFKEGDLNKIDEIKGIYADMKTLDEPIEVHLAQAKCYAYMLATEEEYDKMGVRMTYADLDTYETKYFEYEYTYSELAKWFDNLYKEYKKWIEFEMAAKRKLIETGSNLEFPFSYREGQEELVKDVYRAILRKKNLFIEAPTGVGKTVSTIYPAVKALSMKLSEKIFYLTSKTIVRTAAMDCFGKLIDNGLKTRVITITAKDKVCFLEKRACNPIECPYAKGYYDKVNDATFEFIQREGVYDRETIAEFAREHEICPFEFSLDVSLWCDAIICDYNYVFDPNVYLRRFFEEGIADNFIFLVDEAHNMVDRARKMYSACINKEEVLRMKQFMISENMPLVARELDNLNKILLGLKRECEDYKVLETYSQLNLGIHRLNNAIMRMYEINKSYRGGEAWDDFSLRIRHFVNMLEIADDDYLCYSEHTEDGDFVVNLACIETAYVLQAKEIPARSTIFFSATLLPINYYKHMLTTEEEPYAIYAKTSFDNEKKKVLIATDVSSKYTRRNKAEYRRIAEYVEKAYEAHPGNYMVFFPSYKMMLDVYDEIRKDWQEDEEFLILQTMDMDEESREAFLQNFGEDTKRIGFAVLGGVFSEGIDLTGDRLIGAIIVGTGFPKTSHEREILKKYYDDNGKSGFDYSYRFPGLNKVLQAGGRVIRTAEDKGVILLLDERFLQADNKALLPKEWENYETVTVENVSDKIRTFYQ
ncbi:MAG: ATP-dependent DNA helicase [Lachnospiraceae bacterium]|nr:ATP-dependent DNA helicase [Lachnospiraceae bacterium]MBR5790012.1 ATP-dependent DNA helicase [Lachnospiraceae bacterium]